MVYIYYITVVLSLLYIFGYRYRDHKPGFVKAIFTVLILIMFVELAIQEVNRHINKIQLKTTAMAITLNELSVFG